MSHKPVDPTRRVLGEVYSERVRQDEKWGEQNHPDGTGSPAAGDVADSARRECQWAAEQGRATWGLILQEEFWEVAAENNPECLRAELIQVAAVAVAWVEAIDRR